ncbi:molybdopterin-guanine dinucleotide biosynthesis protein B [Syntrophomonas palmitatica]|uniref:molybdopterin-guanine dinucleotide biosynthesis protein B n=1 Tax=Syntrophomonas palmitatica TaxID=402877 RepID=UPI00241FCB16|nr:molybdopterin-guanine dinucleotide biosynthesis protein B [Syntrophomonas palmitatica]
MVGYSNSGKTTIVSGLVHILTAKGYKVAVIKHAAHGYSRDIPGKDSFQHFAAGAQQVIVAGPDSITLHKRYSHAPNLQEVLELITEVDLIIVEGYKNEPGPKIEIVNSDDQVIKLTKSNELIAIISEEKLNYSMPCYNPAQLEQIAEFIAASFLTQQVKA